MTRLDELTPEQLLVINNNLEKLTPERQAQFREVLLELQKRKTGETAQVHFLDFVKQMWPSFIGGKHHKIMAEKFEAVARGEIKRLAISLPPRHTKSEFASYLLPAWFLGNYPHKKIMQASHTTEMAVGFGRKVRNLVDSEAYKTIFRDVELQADSKAAGRWGTNKGGVYNALGVGSGAAGMGADIFVIDDPHNEQDIINGNTDAFDKAWDWYMSGPRQRLQPGGGIIVVHCMTGDTKVLLSDGTQKDLRDIKVGDQIATYDEEKITTSKVLNWQSNGFDYIYEIRTIGGTISHANERHPFLVDFNGVRQWIRLKDLQTGMLLVASKGVLDQQERKQNHPPERYAAHASRLKTIINSTLMLNIMGLVGKVGGKGLNALKTGVMSLFHVMDYVLRTITKLNGLQGRTAPLPSSGERTGLSVGMVLLLMNTSEYLKTRMAFVPYVSNLSKKILERTGIKTCVLTTVTKQEKSEDCYATTVTSPSDMETLKQTYSEPLNTYEIILDEIVSITPAGYEEVFDIQVERTENFIANGLVSHNTRWSKKDLIGRLLEYSAKNPDADQWEYIEFPAVFDADTEKERSLWPEFWPLPELQKIRNTIAPYLWNAQYMQNPTTEEGALIKKEWWKDWDKDDPPECQYTILSLDAAQEAHNRADFSAITLWGVFYKTSEDTGLNVANVILLNAWKARMEFPELKKAMLDEYKEWEPDAFIVEKKSAGAALYQEFRSMGIPVSEFTPTKGNDKIARVNAISDMFSSGMIWAPLGRRWAEEVIQELSDFPNGDHDDYVDSTSQALMRIRKGGFIRLPSDYEDESPEFRSPSRKRYYSL